MKRFPLRMSVTVCFPLLTVGCPDDTAMDDEAGDTGTDEATGDESTGDETAGAESTSEETTSDESTSEESTSDESTAETTDTTETGTETGGVCGDMVIDANEECEGADLGGADCVSLGFSGGELLCGADCLYDASGCIDAACGNAVVEGDEQCDGADLGGLTCVDYGFGGGELSCADDCTANTSACNACGNDVIDDLEVCDGADFGGATCESLGFGGGQLGCAADCSAQDTSSCSDIVLCNDTDTAILDEDPNGVIIPVVIPDMGTIADIDISVDITHTWLSDLEVSLDRGGMTSTFMFRDIAIIGDTPDSCDGDDMIATLDDAAAEIIQDQACVFDNIPAVQGTFQPEQMLAAFNGSNSAATWNLKVVDDAAQDVGTVNQFCVYIKLQ